MIVIITKVKVRLLLIIQVAVFTAVLYFNWTAEWASEDFIIIITMATMGVIIITTVRIIKVIIMTIIIAIMLT